MDEEKKTLRWRLTDWKRSPILKAIQQIQTRKAERFVKNEEWDNALRMGKYAVPPLIESLKGNGKIRWCAARALVKIGIPAVPALIEALKDQNENVRFLAAWALGAIRNVSAVPALVEAMNEENLEVKFIAAEGLEDILKELIAQLNSANERSSKLALQKLVKIGEPAVPDLIKAFSRSPFDDGCSYDGHYYARRALVEIGNPAIPHLINALKNMKFTLWDPVARIIGEIGDHSVSSSLVMMLMDKTPGVRERVKATFGYILDKCDNCQQLDEFQKELNNVFKNLTKKSHDREAIRDVGNMISSLIIKIAQKRNPLLEDKGILLSDIPKPPKRGTIYRTLDSRRETIKRSVMERVRNG